MLPRGLPYLHLLFSTISSEFSTIAKLSNASESGGNIAAINPKSRAIGKYQFMPNGSAKDVVQNFLSSPDATLRSIGQKLSQGGQPGTPGFEAAWQAVAKDPTLKDAFEKGQDAEAKRMYYDKAVAPYVQGRSDLVKAVAFATSIHSGPGTATGVLKGAQGMSDDQVIQALYTRRAAGVTAGDQVNLAKEKAAVMASGGDLSAAISNYTGGKGGGSGAPGPVGTAAAGAAAGAGGAVESVKGLMGTATEAAMSALAGIQGMGKDFDLGAMFGTLGETLKGQYQGLTAAAGSNPISKGIADITGGLYGDVARTQAGLQASMAHYGETGTGGSNFNVEASQQRLDQTMNQMNATMQSIMTREDPVKNALHGPEKDRMAELFFSKYATQ